MNTDGIPSQHATLSDSHALLQLFLPTAVRAGCCYVRSVCVPEGDQARTLASVSLGERCTEPAGPIPPQGDSEEVGPSPTESAGSWVSHFPASRLCRVNFAVSETRSLWCFGRAAWMG